MISAHDLKKRFGDITAVGGISFDAQDGEVTGLLGPNGAGKTTTLRLLYGLLKADAGSIEIDGIDIAADPNGARRSLGVLPDAWGLYPRLTAREHIQFFGQLRGMAPREIEQRTEQLKKLLDMDQIIERRVRGFSRGERIKVAMAQALLHQPQTVLLDEPTSGLDVMATRAVRDLVRGLRDAGSCVLFSSHVMQEVAALCDRIILIAHGAVVASGTPDDLRAAAGEEDLEDAFVLLTGQQRGSA